MDEFIKLLDKNLDYVDHKISGDICYIKVVSNRKIVNCPFCGKPSSRVHSTYERSFQDLPIQGKKVIIILLNRRMFCDNTECNHKTFGERFKFLPSKAKKTNRLEDEIIRLSLNCSSTSASKMLRNNIADIGKSAICCLLKKETPIINKDTITDVCIDDFALRKRKSYGTIMVDIKTHHILDMINSREYDTVKDWLKSYKNLRIVSRDGSITYHNAISDSHPDAIQISDRFHLLKNLTSYAVDYLKKKFKTHISIPLPNDKNFTEE